MTIKSSFKTSENVNEFHVLRIGNEYLLNIEEVDYWDGWLDCKSVDDILKAYRFHGEFTEDENQTIEKFSDFGGELIKVKIQEKKQTIVSIYE